MVTECIDIMVVQHEGNDRKARFFLEEDGKRMATLEYVFAGDDKFIIEHTEVDAELEGKGVGKLLVQAAVELAREKNLKIIPLCPYAHAQFKKNAAYKDVWFGK